MRVRGAELTVLFTPLGFYDFPWAFQENYGIEFKLGYEG
jgi:hypothetical protein